MQIGAKIKALRVQKGVSQEELGKALSRSHAAISDIERGKTELSVKDLYQIANFFDVSITFFLEENRPTTASAVHHERDAKDMTPEEKVMADKVGMDFIKYARSLMKDKKDE